MACRSRRKWWGRFASDSSRYGAERISQQFGAAVTTEFEASGGVNLETVRAIAETGVERISVGALTHSAVSLDVALDWEI